ncbi:hypothetical protein M3204_13655 [Mesobacillus subterraneus]|jgi:hypothetical protein|uniref:hypothetical protein n=1 Tax=Mesobacillus subterraneus TaxID=285983 RepID=UPI00203B1220|nr:hypothetical protein [Mesobacillus subterraneus]MCM3665459.1 hypothetical protein [Mesobacillus subterraneus]MCM3684534.1 hypothetical protein [Mesobacillus subterraneus]
MEDFSVVSMIFTAILTLGCIFLVLVPLFGWDSYFTVKTSNSFSPNEKEVLMTTLNEIEFEYNMGKLSKKDYMELKKQYELQAAAVMKNEAGIVETSFDQKLLDDVEKEIQQAMLQYKKNKGES